MSSKRTKFAFRIVLLLGTVISLYFVPWLLVKAWLLPLPDSVQQQVDEAIDHGFDGMIVYIDQKGQTPQHFTSGWHNKASKIKAKPHALFKIASISKLFDAVAVTKLVHDGRLSLDKTLAEYLPEIKGQIANANTITVNPSIFRRALAWELKACPCPPFFVSI